MLEEMPDVLWQHWQAFIRLRDSDYRQQVQWDLLKETDEAKFREEQEQAVLSIIRDAKARSVGRHSATNKSKQPGFG